MLDKDILDNNPDLNWEYNVPRAITTFNKRIEPLTIVFKEEVRNNLIVNEPDERGIFTKSQCELIAGVPFEESDQDTIEDLLTISDLELKFWDRVGVSSEYIYELAEPGWEEHIN